VNSDKNIFRSERAACHQFKQDKKELELFLHPKRRKFGTSSKTKARRLQQWKKTTEDFLGEDLEQIIRIWIQRNRQCVQDLFTINQQICFSKNQCYNLQLSAGLSNHQWEVLCQTFHSKYPKLLFSSRTLKRMRQKEMDQLITELDFTFLPGRVGCFLNPTKVIKFVLNLYPQQTSSPTFRIGIDGRKINNSKEIMIGITLLPESEMKEATQGRKKKKKQKQQYSIAISIF